MMRNETLRLIVSSFCCLTVGIFIGVSFPKPGSLCNFSEQRSVAISNSVITRVPSCQNVTNPPGTERLPPGIITASTDLFPRRLWGKPSEDFGEPAFTPKYLLTLTVGLKQKEMVNKAVSRFNKDWQVMLFHYDGKMDEWDDLEWSQRAIHVLVRKQTKWWYAKRFLYPNVVKSYEYVFVWDEDLDLEHFDPEAYIALVKKYGLEISQPGLESSVTWQMTKRRGDVEVHKETEEKPGWCKDGPQKPPCAGFVEIMAPVFSRQAWRCFWHLIPTDLVHGWGLDFSMQKCVKDPHEKIGVVDAQWIRHKGVPSLGDQGQATEGQAAWQGVRERCKLEWAIFSDRLKKAEQEFANATRQV